MDKVIVTEKRNASFDRKYAVNEKGCWIWTSYRNAKGYGVFSYAHGSLDRILAHRYSYLRFKGNIPDGLFVLHSCDDPACCNPSCLRVGTKCENNQEMFAKGRAAMGDNAPWRTVDSTDVLEIRRLRALGMTTYALADKYGITQQAISKIALGQRWKHI